MKRLSILCVLVCLLASCTKRSTHVQLQGQFLLVNSGSGTIGVPLTANPIVFLGISRNSFRKYVDNELVLETGYTVHESSSDSGTEAGVLVFDDGSEQAFELRENKLWFHNDCDDCLQQEYVRNDTR